MLAASGYFWRVAERPSVIPTVGARSSAARGGGICFLGIYPNQRCLRNRRNSKIKYATTARLIARAMPLPMLTRRASS